VAFFLEGGGIWGGYWLPTSLPPVRYHRSTKLTNYLVSKNKFCIKSKPQKKWHPSWLWLPKNMLSINMALLCGSNFKAAKIA